MSEQPVRQAVRAKAALRKDRADREPRLEGLAVAVLTGLGEGELWSVRLSRAGRALLAMIDDKGLSLREAVDWCGNGVTLREMTWLRRLAQEVPDGNGR